MFDAYKRFFRFSGTEKSTWYKGMAFELLRSIFEALQFVALLIVLRALVEQNITGATAWTALGIMQVSFPVPALCLCAAGKNSGFPVLRASLSRFRVPPGHGPHRSQSFPHIPGWLWIYH